MNLETAVKSWEQVAPNLRFLGQIALSESDMLNYMERLGKDLNLWNNFVQNSTALAVLAVNCAYYYYNNEGFWKHFCEQLNINCTPSNQAHLGEAIESYLSTINKNFQHRAGPNRYVSHILEQCGVSSYFLNDFVEFMKYLKQRGKWDAVAEFQFNEFSRCVPENLPKYLRSFLTDKGGWAFSTSVAKNLSQLERRLLTPQQLVALPGYRPGFWRDFFALYKGNSFCIPHSTVNELKNQTAPMIAPPFMRWEAPLKCPAHILTSPVGTRPLPKLLIANHQSISSMEYLFIYEFGRGPKSIPATMLEEFSEKYFALDLEKLELDFPCKLTLWFEATGRTLGAGGQRVTNELTVYIIDDLSIGVSDNLVPPEDYTIIELDAPDGYTLTFSTDSTPSGNFVPAWRVACKDTPLQGVLEKGKCSFCVSIPIYRDILRLEDGSKILLKTEVGKGQFVKVEGRPDSDLVLKIQNDEMECNVFSGGRFGEDGILKINTKSLQSGLSSWNAPWGIITQGTGSPFGGLLYIDILLFLEKFSESKKCSDIFFKGFPNGSGSILEKLYDTLHGKKDAKFNVNDIYRLPKKLQAASWVIAACARAFNNAAIEGFDYNEPDQPIPIGTRHAIKWYKHAKAILANDNSDDIENLLNSAPDIRAVYAPGWKKMLEEERSRLERLNHLEQDFSTAMAEWVKQITSAQPSCSGMIACLPNGMSLISAWRSYFRRLAAPEVIYDQARVCSTEAGLTGDLAKILQLVILKDTNRRHLMDNIDIADMSSDLKHYANALKYDEEFPAELVQLKRLLQGQQ
jgi:hypothetical protein